jgi:fatty-acyl-CoA synthase
VPVQRGQDRPRGRRRPDDEVGELLIRGPLVFQGYWNNEAETRAAIVDGWLHTGDLAIRDPSGYFRIVDRKDMIISGGLNVYPAEVESALLDLEGVLEYAAYGVPDEKWGEAVAAAVVLAPGSGHDRESIRTGLRTRIAAYEIPSTSSSRPPSRAPPRARSCAAPCASARSSRRACEPAPRIARRTITGW